METIYRLRYGLAHYGDSYPCEEFFTTLSEAKKVAQTILQNQIKAIMEFEYKSAEGYGVCKGIRAGMMIEIDVIEVKQP